MSFVENAVINNEKIIKVDFEDKFKKIVEESNISYSEAYQIAKKWYVDMETTNIEEKIKENKKYVGKYFKMLHPILPTYIKVISEASTNIYNVECLIFDECPTYWFDYQNSKVGTPGDYCLGSFDFLSVRVESFLIKDLQYCEEITKEDFDNALRNYIEKLINLEFTREECYRIYEEIMG